MNLDIGDRITITMDYRDDPDLADWLIEQEENGELEDGLVTIEVDEDQHMCWIDGCPYGISLDIVSEYNGSVDFIVFQ